MSWSGCSNFPAFRWWGWRYRNRWWGKWGFRVAYIDGVADGTAIELGPVQITVGFMDSGLRDEHGRRK